MLTKGAIGNLVNRYRAVLQKCNLINTFGSLAVASMLVLGGAGVASAADQQAQAVSKTYDGSTFTPEFAYGDKIVGGWNFGGTIPAGAKDIEKTDLTLKNVIITNEAAKNGHVYGGSYIKTADDYTLNESNLTIESSTIEMVVGGHGAYNADVNLTTGSTNLLIKSGNFGAEQHETNCVELLVAAGNVIRTNVASAEISASSTLTSANMTITGGTFNAAVVGGSAATVNHNGNKKVKSVSVTDLSTSTTITGGTFSHPIVAGGMAYGPNATSLVKSATLEISGPVTLKSYANIYAGGIKGGWNGPEATTSCDVEHATVNIKNADVTNIFGTNVSMEYKTVNGKHTWEYKPLKEDIIRTSLTMTNSTANEVFIPGNESSVALRSENAGKVSIKTLTVQNADKVTISADGQTNDKLDGNASQLTGIISAEKIVYLDAPEAESNDLFAGKEVVMEAGEVTGEVTATFDENGKLAKQTEKPNETNVAMADLPTINLMLTRVEMNDLRKRMGDIRLLEGNTGVWARWDGGKLKGDSGLTNDFHKIQIGADTATGIDSLRLGAAFSYTNSDMDFAKANAESDTLSFAGYGVWTADNGMFADVIARLAFVDTEVQTDKVKGDLNNLALSLSGEFGWRFDVCDQFFVEPQVELTYTYINSDDFKYNGTKFDFEDSDSLIGRAGLAAGWKLPNDLGDLYARASVVQEFLGDGKLTVRKGSTVRYNETDGNDTWLEYGIGANVKVSKNAYIFADVERTAGADIEEEWRGTVGLRYSF